MSCHKGKLFWLNIRIFFIFLTTEAMFLLEYYCLLIK